ncbi:AlpA family phage regulatory protein [bacterium BD-1]|nr:AlpA family phage regulatory protein [Ottowia caeni]
MSAVPSASSTPPPRLIRLPVVVSMVGLSRSEIWRRIAAGRFPKPLKLGPNTSAFVEAEVAAWVAEQIAANPPESRR